MQDSKHRSRAALYLDDPLLKAVDSQAAKTASTRSSYLRGLVCRGLAADGIDVAALVTESR